MHKASGLHVLQALLKTKRFTVVKIEVIKNRKTDFSKELGEAQKLGWSIRYVEQFSDKQVGRQHGVISYFNFNTLDFKQLDPSSSRLLMLDRVQDPHNLGACLRSAAAFGVDAVIMPQRSSAPINDIVHQVSCGGSIIVPLVFVNNLSQSVSELKDLGIWFVATTEHATQTIADVPLNRNLCLLMGSEGEGVRQKLLEVCDYKVCIKTSKWLPTLNVSVATGVLLHAMYQPS
ncbi:23S rRNA (guanosine(2251)-2'-O)-methyltransferase RlmB [Candidatus Comchoanobacter bicostacola]|uniref:23S rRNA (Guanosine(2251)-2'-O)-methyltransferase RlmB n=1 Tax=Candidatus Comchoanobacter bicostacola TaxID=2919598 RepID=A0ABY5DJZ3_9GAMM|nr:23S rRNA (guanosine(2251)-2'-O)-methyltransferase RlmB [Candidatus Comchoanobacter bicostacola]UTC24813.1 23S rRNA (guanosine(2251)-2'-O)-methyltransferase RlmB [Candidatus Comchoanobacter bicostacola]